MAVGKARSQMPAEVRYYTDPGCSWSWGSEPKLRKLMWEFGSELRFRWVMGGLARRYDSDYRDEQSGIGTSGNVFWDLAAHWLQVAERTGMPLDPTIWRTNPIGSTYPACQAVKAAAEQGPPAAYAYLRRLREGLMIERKKLDHAEALVGEAGAAGLDVERFRVDLGSHAITEAFASDLDEVRSPPDEARRAGKVKDVDGRDRVAFPSALFVSPQGDRRGVWGWQPYDAYREAATAAGAEPAAPNPADPIEVVKHFGRAATREIEVICERPRPLVEAELWAAAREWRLRPVGVLTGTMWEPAEAS